MTLYFLTKLFACLILLLFVIGAFSQSIQFPANDWQYRDRNSCQRDSACSARNRCPPSRRILNTPQCFYNGGYYRWTRGVCCRNRNRNAAYPVAPPAATSPAGVPFPNGVAGASPPFSRNDIEQCLRGSRCSALSRCPLSRRPTVPTPCFYEGFSGRNQGVCCNDAGRGLNLDFTNPPPSTTMMPTTTMMPATTTTDNDAPTSSPTNDCGRSFSTSGFMIGGAPARPGVWPWMVAITKREPDGTYLWCTGSIIDRTHALTAAHCFNEDRDVTLYTLRFGNVDQRLGEAYSIERLSIPDSFEIGRFYSDLAVITLDRPINTPDYMPICLPDSGFVNFTGRGVTLAGWGSTTPGGPTSDILQQLVSMPVVSTYQCDTIFRRRLSDFDSMFPNGINTDFICAGFLEGGRDSCGGDSGGPMMVPDDGRWYQIGIVSFGHSRCATPGFPAGYTRVSTFLDFILGNL